MNSLRELVRVANAGLQECGVKVREREVNGVVEYSMLVPTTPRKLVITARVALPRDEVGRVFKGKFAGKAKKLAKKLAKSKVLSKMAKLAPLLANAIPPPAGQIISAASTAVIMAKKIANAAKKGNPKAKAFANAAATVMAKNIQKSRSVLRAAPGYPQALAATQPGPQPSGDYGAAPDNFGDADPSAMEDYMDPSPGGDVDVDASDENVPEGDFGGPDASWSEDEG